MDVEPSGTGIITAILLPQKMQPLANDKMILTGSNSRGSLELNNSKTSEALMQIQKSILNDVKQEYSTLASKTAVPVSVPDPKPVVKEEKNVSDKRDSQVHISHFSF
jgi:hypothetical protein